MISDSSDANISPELRRLLAPLVGRWQGVFKVFQPDGQPVRKIDVWQHYVWMDDVLGGNFMERGPDGTVIHAKARLGEDQGQLFCEVTKSDSTGSLHFGRWEDRCLFWHRRDDENGVVECFKELIVRSPKGRIYMIDGFGVYGHEQFLFEGQYWEQAAGENHPGQEADLAA